MDENNLPTREDIEITIEVEPDPTPVRDDVMATDDPEADRAQEDEILARLERGDTWAWCVVTVRGTWGGHEAADVIGGCSYESEADFVNAGDYYEDMVAEVVAQIRAEHDRAECYAKIQLAANRLRDVHGMRYVRTALDRLIDTLEGKR